MGTHDDYGKKVSRLAAGTDFSDTGSVVEVDYGAGQHARIDGVVDSLVAVEVESRTAKQVRGAVLDLIWHRYPKKLLVLIPMHMYDKDSTATQCLNALVKYSGGENVRASSCKGPAIPPCRDADVATLRGALTSLGWTPPDR